MDDLVKNRVAIIPARGGSKRLPNKNTMDFYGKPMIAWTIDAALESRLFDEVLVSTDSEDIASISRSCGASVPFLRTEYSDDYSTVSEATIHALKQLQSYNGKTYKTIVQLMANCPLRSSKSLKDQVTEFENSNSRGSLISGFKYGMFNPWWAHYKDENGQYQRLHGQGDSRIRSQDLPDLFCPTGATWISHVDRLNKYKTFYSPHYKMFELTWHESVDIDDYNDLLLAKAAFNLV
ncbi:acylneuraminate cytidylyltransferase family protein [bacterium]|nr:acylneuraminate cytidylyltransferase family protein [bacterium]